MSYPICLVEESNVLSDKEQATQFYELTRPHRELSYFTTRNASEQLDSILKSNLDSYQSNDIILTEKNTVEAWALCSAEKNQDEAKRISRELDKWTRIPLNEQDAPVQNSIGITRKKSTLSHNLSLDTEERSSPDKEHSQVCLTVTEDEVHQLTVSEQKAQNHLIESSPKSKRSSWFYSLFHELKKPHRLFLPVTKKSSVMPYQSDTVPKKQRSFESILHRKKPQEIPDSPIVYTRYPVQTEHAIYRLSHQKLSNSYRPLQQQVMISNLMFWYLSISNRKSKNQRTQRQGSPPPTGKMSLGQMYMQKSFYTPETPKKSDPYQPIRNPNYTPSS